MEHSVLLKNIQYFITCYLRNFCLQLSSTFSLFYLNALLNIQCFIEFSACMKCRLCVIIRKFYTYNFQILPGRCILSYSLMSSDKSYLFFNDSKQQFKYCLQCPSWNYLWPSSISLCCTPLVASATQFLQCRSSFLD